MSLVERYGAEAVRRALAKAQSSGAADDISNAVEHGRLRSADWRVWLRHMFPGYFPFDFGPHQSEMFEWGWALERGRAARPFVAAWARGGAKSTCAEGLASATGARRTRKYVLYVCDVQTRADDHVGNIAAMLECEQMQRLYPEVASMRRGMYGNRAWRRNRIRTASGFTVDAIGLDVAVRGVKIEEDRPDLVILDDIDDALDGPGVVDRKITALTKGVLPALSANAAVLAVQNLIHVNSIFMRLVNLHTEPADFLARRIVSGPVPALRDFSYEREQLDDGTFHHKILAGEPTWVGQDLAACQAILDDIGLLAFLSECQHLVEVPPGGLFDHVDFVHCRRDDMPTLVETVVVVDPAVTDTDNSDSQAVVCEGLGRDGKLYTLRAWEQRATPLTALRMAITWAFIEGAQYVVVETDQGGDTWESVYREAMQSVLAEHPEWENVEKKPLFDHEKAGSGHGPKTHRVSQTITDYEKGKIVHVLGHGADTVLEAGLRRFPRTKPLDVADARYWSWWRLRRWRQATVRTAAQHQLPGGADRRR